MEIQIETDPQELEYLQILLAATPAKVESENYSIQEASKLIGTLIANVKEWKALLAKHNVASAPVVVKETVAAIVPGIYQNETGIYKVKPARSSDRTFAFLLVEKEVWVEGDESTDGEDKIVTKGEFLYQGVASRFVKASDKMEKANAVQFGLSHNFCCCCGKLLTADNSVDLGIGPICSKKYF